MLKIGVVVALAVVAASGSPLAAEPSAVEGGAVEGATVYERRCGACHSLDTNRVGPQHRGVFGRRAGAVAGYEYTDALRTAEIVWMTDTLDRWLTDPETLIPGQKMGFRLRSADERAAVIAFLRSVSAVR